ncbi:MAG: adenylosuccinate lyase family protein, partial [Rhodospirillales bacterium]|nr:adenylosuccinate lyase family protein [Rhodospirillales bacterium]
NIDATRGLVFADAAAVALVPALGRAAAHDAVEAAASKVRETGGTLREALAGTLDPAALDRVFDLAPAVAAARARVAPAVAFARDVATKLSTPD